MGGRAEGKEFQSNLIYIWILKYLITLGKVWPVRMIKLVNHVALHIFWNASFSLYSCQKQQFCWTFEHTIHSGKSWGEHIIYFDAAVDLVDCPLNFGSEKKCPLKLSSQSYFRIITLSFLHHIFTFDKTQITMLQNIVTKCVQLWFTRVFWLNVKYSHKSVDIHPLNSNAHSFIYSQKM